MESLRNVIKVSGVKACDGDTSIHSHIDGILISKCVDLILAEASIGKHTDLAGSVAPVMFVSKVLELLNKALSHVLHSSGHHDKVFMPHLGKFIISKNDVDKTCTVDWWVRVDWSGDLFDT